METKFKLDSNFCSHNQAEYVRLHDELFKRMEWLFSHGYTLVSMVAVFWSLTLSGFVQILTSADPLQTPFDWLFPCFLILLMGLPAALVLPFSVKYQDSLRTIANISSYIRVFFELPSMLKKDAYCKKDEQGNGKHYTIFSWETLHCDTHLERTKGFGMEYFIIAVAAVVLSVGVGIGCFIMYQYSVYCVIGVAMFWLLLLYFTYKIWKNSCTQKTLKTYFTRYLLVYLDKAVSIGILTKEERTDYVDYVKNEDLRESKMLSTK